MPTPFDACRSFTLADLLAERARSHPGHAAVADGDLTLTYPKLDRRVDRLAAALTEAGVGTGDRVAWLGQNSFRTLESLLATARAGAVFCPLNWRQSASEVAFVLDDLTPAVVIWQDAEIGATVAEARGLSAHAEHATWVQHDADNGYEAFLASGAPGLHPGADIGFDTPCLAIYTAAFAGRPNAALLTHGGLILQNVVIGRTHDISDESVNLNAGPLFHVATLMLTLSTLHHGGLNVFTAKADAAQMCELIERHRVTHAFIPGPTAEAIREIQAVHQHDLSSLWDSPDLADHHTTMVTPHGTPWDRRPGGYGQTEAVGLTTFRGLGAASTGSTGRSGPLIALRIVDDAGEEVSAGEVGEIVLRGPTVMAGYLNRPEENASRSRGGWHHTNDLGRREPDGSVTFVGPRIAMIKSGAENVYPAEVEEVVRSHPGVADVCVIGVPDPRWQQSVRAVVVRDAGSDVTESDIVEHCRQRIASYKKPSSVVFVSALPRTGQGFVDRDAVDADHGGGGYPGAGS
jgi:acyl-CoA synthetase (AMP-forming)/AMP-acid ligase II